jgi:uncharacterized protein (TIGR02569 family)
VRGGRVMVPAAVLTAFGLSEAALLPLLGGTTGSVWRAGDIVLKPADSALSARWTADVFSTLSGPGFRVPRPVKTTAGDWVADGWVGWRWLAGVSADWSGVSPRWRQLAETSRAFHAALAGVQAPRFLGRDASPWTVADQVAWGERDAADLLRSAGRSLGGQLHRLLGALRPIGLPAQLVHGDLGGNVLFAADEPPAVIDFAPYWRPAGLAIAVAAADALLWCDADPAILGELADEPELDPLLARALVYRLVTEVILRGAERGHDDGALDGVSRISEPVTDLVLARLAGRPGPATYLDDRRLAALTGRAAGAAVVGLRPARTATGWSGQQPAVPGDAVGYSRAARALARLSDGRSVFVKAAGPGEDLAAELAAYESVAPAPFMPGVVALSRDPVPLIVLEALPADGWVTQWTPEAVDDAADLLALVHATRAPDALPRWADPDADGARAWQLIARQPARLLRMHVCTAPWLAANLAALTGAASQAQLAGDRLVHGDVHGPNLCYHRDGLVLVDWATAAAGNPWFDTHDWLVAMAATGGPPPEERQGPGAAGHAALIAGNEAVHAPARDSKPALFELRRQRLASALAWAARLLRLTPPEPA